MHIVTTTHVTKVAMHVLVHVMHFIVHVSVVGMTGMVIMIMGSVVVIMTCMSKEIVPVIILKSHILMTKGTEGEEIPTVVIIIIFKQVIKIKKSVVPLIAVASSEVEGESLPVLVVAVLVSIERFIESLEEVIHVEREGLSPPAPSLSLGLVRRVPELIVSLPLLRVT